MVAIVALVIRLVVVAALLPLSLPPAPSVVAPGVQLIAAPGGQPDDITTDAQGNLMWGDLARGTVEQFANGRITTLARGLSVPEGIVALPDGAIAVAEQGYDRVTRINRDGTRTVLVALQPVAGQEGVDGIGWDAHARRLLVPDSPRGTLLSVSTDGRQVRMVARGLLRPVDAVTDAHGNMLVPDEHLGALVVITARGTMVEHGPLATPDDVAVDRAGAVWITTLDDNSLWRIDPSTRALRRVLTGLANPQGLTLDRCGDPIVVEQNAARIVRLLLTPAAARCPL